MTKKIDPMFVQVGSGDQAFHVRTGSNVVVTVDGGPRYVTHVTRILGGSKPYVRVYHSGREFNCKDGRERGVRFGAASIIKYDAEREARIAQAR